eukprot:CAMPEP_0116556666 /NCGR_PEP_ID=MMETSP0397-20121206/8819_1 /TAXON_ID=216820 /ORGANISM="Cyclophora tenuis, Strain ECT3854" /LENGTH=117 /DNA_ID=CAMNT_0004082053 /DNA_START=280 /DNA_END=633 /DNA_ORIENTATION=-
MSNLSSNRSLQLQQQQSHSMVRRDSFTEGILAFDCDAVDGHDDQGVLMGWTRSLESAFSSFRNMAEDEMEESRLNEKERRAINRMKQHHHQHHPRSASQLSVGSEDDKSRRSSNASA